MQCFALDDATGMAQSIHAGGQPEVRYQTAEDRTVLPEDRSIALVGLDVHRSQGHLVFHFNPDERQRLYRLGSQPTARCCNVRMACPPEQANRGVA
jgi:hypothetical protein